MMLESTQNWFREVMRFPAPSNIRSVPEAEFLNPSIFGLILAATAIFGIEDCMEPIQWYAEASLIGPNRVFCAGSLAQCVRRWTRLTEDERAVAHIQMRSPGTRLAKLEKGQIAPLAASPELKSV